MNNQGVRCPTKDVGKALVTRERQTAQLRQDRRRACSPAFQATITKFLTIVMWHGMLWYGIVWCGMLWCMIWGMAWCGVWFWLWYGMAWHVVVWYSMVWYGMARCGMVWCGMEWHVVVWYGVVRCMIWCVVCMVWWVLAYPALNSDFSWHVHFAYQESLQLSVARHSEELRDILDMIPSSESPSKTKLVRHLAVHAQYDSYGHRRERNIRWPEVAPMPYVASWFDVAKPAPCFFLHCAVIHDIAALIDLVTFPAMVTLGDWQIVRGRLPLDLRGCTMVHVYRPPLPLLA